MSASVIYKEYLTISGSDRIGFCDVETAYMRVVDEQAVEVIIRTRIPQNPERSLRDTEGLLVKAAAAALQQCVKP